MGPYVVNRITQIGPCIKSDHNDQSTRTIALNRIRRIDSKEIRNLLDGTYAPIPDRTISQGNSYVINLG